MEKTGDDAVEDVDDESVVELIFTIKAEWMQQRPELCDVIEKIHWQTMKQTMEVCCPAFLSAPLRVSRHVRHDEISTVRSCAGAQLLG